MGCVGQEKTRLRNESNAELPKIYKAAGLRPGPGGAWPRWGRPVALGGAEVPVLTVHISGGLTSP